MTIIVGGSNDRHEQESNRNCASIGN